MKTKFPSKLMKPKVDLTISMGVATYPDDGLTEDELLKKADKALYVAKNLGRNMVSVAK
ncbi:MAG: diguanylate cyclase [Calditrichales bacterium]|nr:MAG: diguanylate cyclase [Calditrichales bacterium]